MRTTTLPALRVTPEMRREVEALLEKGETLSAFVLDAVTRSIEYRQAQRGFIARGLASRKRTQETGEHVPASAVLGDLTRRLHAAHKARATRQQRYRDYVREKHRR